MSALHGLVAEFASAEDVLAAARRARAAGYARVDAYTPYPVEGLAEALDLHGTWVPPLVLAGGIAGAVGGFALQYWISTVDYPLNVGGRPLNSWPAFIPVTFELTVLCAALTAVISMFALNGLPRPHHPLFGAPGFERASQDRFFLGIEAADPRFDARDTRRFLASLGPLMVSEVDA